MPLIYKPFKSSMKTKEGKQLFYPRLVKLGKVVDTQKLGELIAQKASLTPGDVHNVVRNLMEVMREQLLNSRTVRLDGLGTFTMITQAGGNGVETSEKVNPGQIRNLRCQFTAEYRRPEGSPTTRALTEGVEYVSLAELAKGLTPVDGDGGDGDGGGVVDPMA